MYASGAYLSIGKQGLTSNGQSRHCFSIEIVFFKVFISILSSNGALNQAKWKVKLKCYLKMHLSKNRFFAVLGLPGIAYLFDNKVKYSKLYIILFL